MTTSSKSIGCFISGSVRTVEYPFEVETSDSFYNSGSQLLDTTDLDPTSEVGNEYTWKTCNIFSQDSNYYALQKVYSTEPSGYTSLIEIPVNKRNYVEQYLYISQYYGDYNVKSGLICRTKPIGSSGQAHGGWLFCIDNGETRLYRKSNENDVNSDWDVLEASGINILNYVAAVNQYGSVAATYRTVVSGETLQFYYDSQHPSGGTNLLLIEHQSNRYTSDEYNGYGFYSKDGKLLDFPETNDISFYQYIMTAAKDTEYWTGHNPPSGMPLYIDGIGTEASGVDLYIKGLPQGYCQYTPHEWSIYTSDSFDRGEDLTDLGQTNLVPTMDVGTMKDWKSSNMNISGGGYYVSQREQNLSTPNPTGHVAFIEGNGNYDYQDVSVYLNPYYYYETNNRAGVILRANASGEFGHSRNGILFCLDNGVAKLYKRDNDDDFNAPFNTLVDEGTDVLNTYGSGPGSYLYGTLRAVASGEYIKGYWNDDVILEHIDETLYRSSSNDDMGFYIDDKYYPDSQIYIDDFKCSSANAESYVYCSNSGIPLYTQSLPDYGSGQMPLFTLSKGTASQLRTLYIKNAMAGSGQIPLYTIGHIPSNTGIPLYTISIGDASGQIPLYMVGHIPSNTGIPLYIEGMIRSSGLMPLYTINNPTTSNIALYIHYLAEPMGGSTIPLYLYNSGSTKSQDLVVWGRSLNDNSTNNAIPVDSTIALFTGGDGVYNSVPLYLICGTGELNNSQYLYINSLDSSNNSIPLFMPSGVIEESKNLKLYTHGF